MSEMSERNSVLVAYGLYLLGAMTGGLTTLIGTVLAHIRLKEARGTLYESHYRNLILIFWVWLAVMVVAGSVVLAGMAGAAFSLFASWPVFGLALIPFGICRVADGHWASWRPCLWYYWRLVRGLVLVVDDKPY